MSSKLQVLSLYRLLIRESKKFPSYNFRNYALRRIRDSFKENKSLTDQIQIKQQINKGYDNLEIIKRQVLIGNLYKTDKLVIENVNFKT
ncbi:hypothetical protein ILUMI_20952 [Ignelater luminosus]|uniref:Complex 1 LYR protein domain-containing protein n=1 Tax=Ignelater luminosus TaxID=2038154 RepID=A0A8K0CDF1_IGNLU|nr:hypothetical protein ILUMI_20952 [Ignelater luminosus]